MISALIFSYQNKNLRSIVDNLFENTSVDLHLLILDKHTMERSKLFKTHEYKNKINYHHIFWDELDGPADYKANVINDNQSEYFLLISDDILLSKNWDKLAIEFLKNKKAIISGSGVPSIKKKNLFFFEQLREYSDEFYQTLLIDKNFVFGKTENLKNMYPGHLKYYGEDEMLSLNLYMAGTTVFSAPSSLYSDLNARTLESEYTTFSLEHNYNDVVEAYQNAPLEFLEKQGIDKNSLFKLPYNPNDVSYNPYLLAFQKVNASKFISNTKQIS